MTAVVVIPPPDLWPQIQAIRREYDRQARRWMPHITLIYPFRPREEFEFLAGQFSRVCEGIEPFEIKLKEFFFFRHHRDCYTLWLAPEPREALVRLQTLLLSVVPECDDVRTYEGGFTPHLSVGQAWGQMAMLKLLSMLQASWKPLVFNLNEVCLIYRGVPPDDVFRVAFTVSLGKQSLKPVNLVTV
ncbi:MAG: 2'-5' RNA ligase family protein [Candidatus Brocadia sp.]